MLTVSTITLFAIFQFATLQVSWSELAVQYSDPYTVQKKRLDNIEICKLFNAENSRKSFTSKSMLHAKIPFKPRPKRAILQQTDPALDGLDLDEVRRVENIVESLYDEDPEPRDYRKLNLEPVSKVEPPGQATILNTTGRRFDFAPAVLGVLNDTTAVTEQEDNNDNKVYPYEPWPKKWLHGVIPYYIEPKTYDEKLTERIMTAFDMFEMNTCIRLQRLRELPTDPKSIEGVEWLYINNRAGLHQCVHTNENTANKGKQEVVFGYGCMSDGDIAHELMHILGFSHEHTRPDRDQYITVLWDNIKPGYKKYFESRAEDPLMNLPYDFSSVLHYPPRAFSRNGQRTIITEPGVMIGQREGLSETDIAKVSIVFGSECAERNRVYLTNTCPSVVSSVRSPPAPVAPDCDINQYYRNRLWPFGIVNYRFPSKNEFSPDELDNIGSVMEHIQKTTCIRFVEMASNGKVITLTAKRNTTINGNDSDKIIEAVKLHVNLDGELLDEPLDKDKLEASEVLVNIKDDNEIADVTANTTRRLHRRKAKADDKAGDGAKGGSVSVLYSRRHAGGYLTLKKTEQSGCKCPKPNWPEGEEVIEMGEDCFNSVKDLLHLFGHVLGLDHQHNQHDRDSFIHIDFDQLPEGAEDLYAKLPAGASAGFPYDYQSVMQLPWLKIKDGNKYAMYPVWNDGWSAGTSEGLSATDVGKINKIYKGQCEDRKTQEAKNFEKLSVKFKKIGRSI